MEDKTTEELINETLRAFEVINITKGNPKFSLGAYLNALVVVAREEERKKHEEYLLELEQQRKEAEFLENNL